MGTSSSFCWALLFHRIDWFESDGKAMQYSENFTRVHFQRSTVEEWNGRRMKISKYPENVARRIWQKCYFTAWVLRLRFENFFWENECAAGRVQSIFVTILLYSTELFYFFGLCGVVFQLVQSLHLWQPRTEPEKANLFNISNFVKTSKCWQLSIRTSRWYPKCPGGRYNWTPSKLVRRLFSVQIV